MSDFHRMFDVETINTDREYITMSCTISSMSNFDIDKIISESEHTGTQAGQAEMVS